MPCCNPKDVWKIISGKWYLWVKIVRCKQPPIFSIACIYVYISILVPIKKVLMQLYANY